MKTLFLLKILLFTFILFFINCDFQFLLDDSEDARAGKLMVFVLAGQSNMEGKGFVEPKQSQLDTNGGKGTLRKLYEQNKSKYNYLVNSSGDWAPKNSVWLVDYWKDKKGPLKPDFYGKFMGPELQFGYEVGNHFKNNQVLLIKTAWGGQSLYDHFRPPSSGGQTGARYTEMIKGIKEVLGNIKKYYPNYNGQGYELAGFGWHQGWNDRVNQDAVNEYLVNCVNLINDLRNDLNVNNLPFVLANTGQGGTDVNDKAKKLMDDQMAVPKHSGLKVKDNAGSVETRNFYIDSADSPNGFTSHWNGNALSYLEIGGGMGKMMVKILQNGGLHGNDPGNDPEDPPTGNNGAPTAKFGQTITNLKVQFTDKSIDPDNNIKSWSWNFGDGNKSSKKNPSHTYSNSGTYTVKLTVTDDGGLSNEKSKSITVSSGTNDPPQTTTYSLIVHLGTGGGDYASGKTVTISAEAPPEEGEVFDKWVVISGNPYIKDENSPDTTITMPSGDAEIEATYKNPDLGCGTLPF